MNKLTFILSSLCLISVLNNIPIAQAQIPDGKTLGYAGDLAKAREVRWDRWLSLKKPLLDERKKLLDQNKAKYKAKIEAAESDDQAKAYYREWIIESKKIAAEVQVELDNALVTVNNLFYNDVKKICEKYGQPIPRWAAKYKR